MGSNARFSVPSSVWVDLPQPRSRIALAAETRAAAVASLLRMMPTSTLIAVRVWLRASERIWVRVFDILTKITISSWSAKARIKMCGMIACCDHFRREPYLRLRRPRAAVDLGHAACQARSRAPANSRAHRRTGRCAIKWVGGRHAVDAWAALGGGAGCAGGAG